MTDLQTARAIGARIQKLMHENGVTYVELGERMGVKKQGVHQLANATSGCVPSLRTVMRVAAALGVAPYEILCVLDLHTVPRRKVAA